MAHPGSVQACAKCEFKTLKSETLRSHIKYKHSEQKEKCTDCEYSHAIASKVRAHHRHVHLGEKRLQRKQVCRRLDCQYLGMSQCPESERHFLLFCTMCEFSTTATDYLKRHIQTAHLPEIVGASSDGLLRKCKLCDYKTRWGSSLTRHKVNKHMDEQTKQENLKWKKCTFENCLFKTPMPVVLKRHIESKHEGIIHFSCKFMNCAYVTDDKRSFNEHTGAHNSLFKCDHCDKVLARPRALKRHIKSVHEGVLLRCQVETNHKEEMREHTLKHTETQKVEDIKGDPEHKQSTSKID